MCLDQACFKKTRARRHTNGTVNQHMRSIANVNTQHKGTSGVPFENEKLYDDQGEK